MDKKYVMEGWIKSCILHFPKKSDFGISKNYSGMTLTFMLLSFITPSFSIVSDLKSKKLSGKIRTAFGEIDAQLHRF